MNQALLENTIEKIYTYLHDVLYKTDAAHLDVDALPPEFKKLGSGIIYYTHCWIEVKNFAGALTKGELDLEYPSLENELAATLKDLHATLRHITWQSQQVAKGDYSQRIEYMGAFSEAFNTMTMQLAQRQQALEEEIERGRKQNRSLEQSIHFFEEITEHSSLWLYIAEKKSGKRIFANHAAENALKNHAYSDQIYKWITKTAIEGYLKTKEELVFKNGETQVYIQVKLYPMQWRQHEAIAFSMQDITNEKCRITELEAVANRDELTNVYSRYYGMQLLKKWVAAQKSLCVCFIDLDNLKYVNDTFGHSTGDIYITSVAKLLENFTPGSVLCRMGGDEFMLAIPDCEQEKAEELMKEKREMLKKLRIIESDICDISYGLVHTGELDEVSPSILLSIADERMYRHKRSHKKRQVANDV